MSAVAENIDYKGLSEASLQNNQQLLKQLAQLQGQLHQLTKLLQGFKSERFVPAAVAAEQPTWIFYSKKRRKLRVWRIYKGRLFTRRPSPLPMKNGL
jgi:hypothetical protein